MIIFLQALYNQNAYIYKYACIRHLKVFKSSPHTSTAINIHHSLIHTFSPATSRSDSEIKISVNNEQYVPSFTMSP